MPHRGAVATSASHAAPPAWPRFAAAFVLGFGLLLGTTATASGQAARADDELAKLRTAASLESAGDFAGAQRILEDVLAGEPQSMNALLAYERVLMLQRRLPALLPALERLLAADPASQLGHHMRLRTLAALDHEAELERAARAWARATPRVETPYRETARIWRTRGDLRRAVQVLDEGRRQIGRSDALALDLGDVYIEIGDARRAIAEWSRAIGPEGQGVLLVQRRLAGLPDGGAQYVGEFVASLLRDPSTPPRRRAAVNIAIEAGLTREALGGAARVFADLPPRERQAFLVEVARRADGAALAPVAYWAYGRLVELGDARMDRSLALRSRYAELALAVGDTAVAADAYRALEEALAPGSPERRQAMAVRIGITAREGDLDAAEREFDAFRAEYARAPEIDGLAADLARLRLEHGDAEAAERVLAGVRGARSALMRGRVLLRRGETARARAALLESAPALKGAEATQTIALAALLGRVSAAGGELLATAWLLVADGDPAAAVERLVTGSLELGDGDRAPLLDFAAGVADDVGLAELAEQARRELIDAHPTARETPGALLATARTLAARGETQAAAALLERLLVDHPRSALVPQARRELGSLGRTAHR
jgi:tetratricopeptide (TPR) repeat protein